MKKIRIIVFLFLSLQLCGQSSYDTLEWDFDILNVNDGFSAGYALDIQLDSSGYLWATSVHGLDRYDGYGVKHYGNDLNDSLSLPSNLLTSLLVDSRNWVWVGVLNKGIYLFNRETSAFHSVSNSIYRHIIEDTKGNIWGNTYDGNWEIIEVDSTKGMNQNFTVTPITTFFDGLPDYENIPLIVFIQTDEIWWVQEDTLFAYTLDYDSKTAAQKLKNKVNRRISAWQTPLCPSASKDHMWLFSDDAYHILSIKTGKILATFNYPKNLGIKGRRYYVNGIDSQGRIFLNIDELGLHIFHPREMRFSLVINKDKNVRRPNIYAGQFLEDAYGNLWFSTHGYGIHKYTKNRDRFHYFVREPSLSPSISQFNIEEGKITTYSHIAHRTYDLTSRQLVDQKTYQKHPDFDPDYLYIEQVLDSENQLWLSYEKDDHVRLKPLDKKHAKFPIQVDISIDTLNFLTTRIIGFEDESTLWSIQVPSLTPRTKTRKHIQITKTDINTNSHQVYDIILGKEYTRGSRSRDFFVDPKNNLWVALMLDGVIQLDIDTGTVRHFYFENSNEASISSNNIYSFHPDPTYPDSILWIGTGNGLNKYTYDLDTFEVFTTNEGLPNNVVYGLLSDKHNNLWLSTNYGLCIFDPRTFSTRNFTRDDGLQENEFNSNSYQKDENGMFYFGGIGGLTYFYPEDFYKDDTESPVVINTLKLNNKVIQFDRTRETVEEGGFVLKSPIDQTQKIEFDYSHQMITFGFSCLDLTKPENNAFRYKLEGFNKDWIEAGVNDEATFTRIPKGRYTFKVQARNSSHIWNTKGAELEVIMHGPWWSSWWFYLLCLVAISGVIYLVYWNRLKQNEKIFTLRNKISTDLHDEIGSTLSSIALFGSVAETMMDSNLAHSKKMLKRINARSTEAMESINDIVWAINSKNDQLKSLVKRMRAYIFQLSEASNVDIKFKVDDNIEDIKMSMAQRKNTYLIYKESINNAFKYAHCETIEVNLQKTSGGLQLIIKDDGIGFNSLTNRDKFTLGGNGLDNMRLRAEELHGTLVINSKEGQGTSVTFDWKPSQ